MNKTDRFRTIIMKMMESVTLDDDNKLVIINETADVEAEELLSQLVVETARDWWVQLESAEDSLSNMSDEISFSEMNADPSHMVSPELRMNEPTAEPTVESMLSDSDFDFGSLLERDDDFGPDDGDDDFDDMMRGDDEAGIGDDAPIDDKLDVPDGEMDSLGGSDDDFDNDETFDFSFLDDDDDDDLETHDDLGSDDDFDDDLETHDDDEMMHDDDEQMRDDDMKMHDDDEMMHDDDME